MFLIYIYNLPDGSFSNVKLPEDTSLFSAVHDVIASARELNDDLKNINKWAFQWKMNIKRDPTEGLY